VTVAWAGLQKELKQHIRMEIGAFAQPDVIHFASGLPKTRSGGSVWRGSQEAALLCQPSVTGTLAATGKIMRRILRKIAHHEESSLGDTSTLADPSVVSSLLSSRPSHAAEVMPR
jgi:acetyl-CoA synthetase